ncbi:hypothetical protein [Flagellimonas nanhaiensis]|uniref:Uncharacterized protein n=1 Tax=Flagellimonas nanhaiensis TaxID=2292706 RepID=A0A371JLB3_9FLAO|nr:hypothetical protein [Allomuricauda nanhaiensis]RDY57728.1 hypothetical protein DX873_17675 [Allomuricauda nanhaiensis]
MTKIKEKWGDYSLREKIAIVIGSVLLTIQVVRYATNTLSENLNIEKWVFVGAVLLLFAPIVLVEIIKKRKGGNNA